MGAARRALIFTESRRTQDYLKGFLEEHGYKGQLLLFNGTNGGPEAKAIYDAWVAANQDSGRSSGSRAVDSRAALIEHFRDNAPIMIATEAAAQWHAAVQGCAGLKMATGTLARQIVRFNPDKSWKVVEGE